MSDREPRRAGHAQPSPGTALYLGREFDPAPHVATPDAALRDDAVFLVESPRVAAMAAARLRVKAVAPAAMCVVEEAAREAARLAAGGRVVIALDRSAVRDRPGVEAPRFGRAASAVAAAGGRAALLLLPPEGSLEAELAAGRPLRIRDVGTGTLSLDPRPVSAGRVLGAAWQLGRRVLGRGLSTLAGYRARRTALRTLPLDALPAAVREAIDATAALARAARAEGIELFALGGLAVDLLAGGPLRARKDFDLAVASEDPAALERVEAIAARLGHRPERRLPGRMVTLDAGGWLTDVFRLAPAAGGLELVFPFMRARLPAAALAPEPGRIGPLSMRPLRADLLLLLKDARLRDVATCFVRHELGNAAGSLADVAALRALLGPAHDPLAPLRSGEAELCRIRGDPALAARAQLREAAASLGAKIRAAATRSLARLRPATAGV